MSTTLLAVLFAALVAGCSDGHHGATPTTRALDPFATGAPSASASASGPAPASSSESSTPARSAPALTLGQCFDTDTFTPGSALDLASARVVDCSAPHQQEVYAVIVEPDEPGAAYPGDDALDALAGDQCLAAFTPYTGSDYQASTLDIANARPDRTAWDKGERNVICALHDADFGELTGSAKAAPPS